MDGEPDCEIENDAHDSSRDCRERRGQGFVSAKRFHVGSAKKNPEKARHEGGPFGERTTQRAGHHRIECSRMAKCRHKPNELHDANQRPRGRFRHAETD